MSSGLVWASGLDPCLSKSLANLNVKYGVDDCLLGKTSVATPDKLSLIPRTHRLEGKTDKLSSITPYTK